MKKIHNRMNKIFRWNQIKTKNKKFSNNQSNNNHRIKKNQIQMKSFNHNRNGNQQNLII